MSSRFQLLGAAGKYLGAHVQQSRLVKKEHLVKTQHFFAKHGGRAGEGAGSSPGAPAYLRFHEGGPAARSNTIPPHISPP